MNYPSIPPLNSQSISVPRQPVALREGQMFHGQIKQLFPGQMAEVQIGGQKLMARLEVPMKAGDAYYFQVKSITPELQIKVIAGPLHATAGQAKQLSNLMDSMQLPKTLEMQSVLNHFLNQKLPISKEILLDAVKLLKTVQPSVYNEALTSIQKLVEMKLPLNEVNLHSLLGVETKEGLHHNLNLLRNALINDTSVQTQLKETILSTLGAASKVTSTAAERALLSNSMLHLLNETAPREERFNVLQLLKSAGIAPPNATLANLQSLLHSDLADSTVIPTRLESGIQSIESRTISPSGQMQTQASVLLEAWKSVLKTESSGASASLQVELSRLKELVKNEAVLQQPFRLQLTGLIEELENNHHVDIKNSPIGEQISKMMIRMIMEQNQTMPFKTDMTTGFAKMLNPENIDGKLPELFRATEQSPLPVAKELIRNAQANVELAIDGKVMKDSMQALFKSLGFNYEAELLHRNADIGRIMEMLKPQLVALLHDSSVSPALREAAEMVITRMNGTLLHSSDTGLNQQIIMQLPLEFLGKKIDATIQWNGRKKDDGKIDADFARILFYLELESIQKTVVDMQVQNRVVTITVFNESNQLKEIGNHLEGKLRLDLESVGYRLSGVAFKNFEEEGKKESKRRNEMISDHGGVDLRI
jgi:hypothetical protein